MLIPGVDAESHLKPPVGSEADPESPQSAAQLKGEEGEVARVLRPRLARIRDARCDDVSIPDRLPKPRGACTIQSPNKM